MPIEENQNSIRARVRLPNEFIQSSFRTITLKDKDGKENGIKVVMGKLLNGNDSMVAQSYIFNKTDYGWTMDRVKAFLERNNLTVKSNNITNIDLKYIDFIT
jgi:hypothetical protein